MRLQVNYRTPQASRFVYTMQVIANLVEGGAWFNVLISIDICSVSHFGSGSLVVSKVKSNVVSITVVF